MKVLQLSDKQSAVTASAGSHCVGFARIKLQLRPAGESVGSSEPELLEVKVEAKVQVKVR